MTTILFKGGRVLDPSQNLDQVLDVKVVDGLIDSVGPNLSDKDADEVVTLTKDQWVCPGLVDIRVHAGDPGYTDKETLKSATQAAAAGGFTSIITMPTTKPVLDHRAVLEYVHATIQRESRIHVYVLGAATKNLDGQEVTEMAKLLGADAMDDGQTPPHLKGVVGFGDPIHPITNTNLMRRLLEYGQMFGRPLAVLPQDTYLTGSGIMNEGVYATLLGIPSCPPVAESLMVARDLQLMKRYGGRVHFCNITTADSVALIRQAKAEGLAVTADTAPHYLSFTETVMQQYDSDFKVFPPLRTNADQAALIAGLKDGTIDCLTSDHTPFHPDEKLRPIDQSPFGVIGLETVVGACVRDLVEPGALTPLELIAALSTRPAACFDLPAGSLKPGSAADVTVIDPRQTWPVDPVQFKSQSRNCPYKGQTLTGQVSHVLCQGHWVSHANVLHAVVQ